MPYEQLKLSNQICFRFYTVSRLITQVYHPYLEQLGLTYPQYLVMLVLWEREQISVNEIAKCLVLNTNTITPLLQRMEKDGLVARTKSKQDSRKVIVSLTQKGRELEQHAAGVPHSLLSQLQCANIPEESAKNIAPILDKLIDTLEHTLINNKQTDKNLD